jgi:hypothetical protein
MQVLRYDESLFGCILSDTESFDFIKLNTNICQ